MILSRRELTFGRSGAGNRTRSTFCHSMPYLILWFIWAERNRSRHQETQFKPYNVVWHVLMFIRNSMANGRLKPKHWRGVRLGVSVSHQVLAARAQPLAMAIKWKPPDHPWLKLNTDGAFNETTSKPGGGGLLRDHLGKLVKAFSTPLEVHSSLEAELLAIIFDLNLAKVFGLPIWIESDAAQAIKLINGNEWGPASTRQAVAQLILLKKQLRTRASFIHREGNRAAYLLAKRGLLQDDSLHMDATSAPKELMDIVGMEEMGIPNIQVRNGGEE